MERIPYSIDRVSETRRIPHGIAKKLGKNYKGNRNSARSHEEII